MQPRPTAPHTLIGMSESELSAEDAKLRTLARATRARTGSAEGAAIRDADGRTYAAATLALGSLQVSAVQACLVMAHASGAPGLEAVLVLGESPEPLPDGAVLTQADQQSVREFAGEVPTLLRE